MVGPKAWSVYGAHTIFNMLLPMPGISPREDFCSSNIKTILWSVVWAAVYSASLAEEAVVTVDAAVVVIPTYLTTNWQTGDETRHSEG